ncbi:hypothetical protein DKP76_07250 [Falsochrobactrum shanghaiense]|uniref:Uncharacterized protein n=1 Tax=Falsochrobactrum shanghaiense TaxID=2201899 RepID=A0A316JUK9_9HYPH|nr:hypothetical protein [Falsochrobactrum shanghaiense]PWL18850.1 hypothetical protein DKP76_07250 [Falsochrobactrum shanghaiense]
MKISIEWLDDTYDCETCGSSWAEGALVYIDGLLVLDLQPSAHCYNGVSYQEGDVYQRILEHLGHGVEQH